jgi:hypothetical protein
MGSSEIVEGAAGRFCTWCMSICAGELAWNTGWPVNAQYAVHANE